MEIEKADARLVEHHDLYDLGAAYRTQTWTSITHEGIAIQYDENYSQKIQTILIATKTRMATAIGTTKTRTTEVKNIVMTNTVHIMIEISLAERLQVQVLLS
ncbi:hypothetical protein PENSUB_4785 [Penicillium subrubescens]|uniref:Uncharacterized protein n=1 Tax=Penicillium subrubescens TaxID=1316194 RepID=A0A1Q5UBM2_9EURO|nr:hypothetical protein PENSUB_4785 [Penicillium subrubescens]